MAGTLITEMAAGTGDVLETAGAGGKMDSGLSDVGVGGFVIVGAAKSYGFSL
jgi:hypothetical protein